MAHPPRSKPPLRSSSGPPNPCTTPSTETLVVVVNLMSWSPRRKTASPTDPRLEALSPHVDHLNVAVGEREGEVAADSWGPRGRVDPIVLGQEIGRAHV